MKSFTEVLSYAIGREEEAYHFLMAVGNRADDDEVREAFAELAQEELDHKAKLELELMKSGKSVDVELKPARSEDEYIISESDAPLDLEYEDLLLLGMAKEDTAFRLYVDLIAKAADAQTRNMLLAIAEQEVKHKLRFETEYDALKNS